MTNTTYWTHVVVWHRGGGLVLAAMLIAGTAAAGAAAEPPGMALIPGGIYTPLVRDKNDLAEIPVAAFWLDARPVTNGEFLAFVRSAPKWRRSRLT